MKTDDLVTMLATGGAAVEPNAAARRYLTALVLGTLGSAILMAVLLGVRPDLGRTVRLPMFWVKLAFAAVLALISGAVALRLARPGSRLAWLPGMLGGAGRSHVGARGVRADDGRRGRTTRTALRPHVGFMPIPDRHAVGAGIRFVIRAMQGLAPTRLRLAGAAAGLVSGSLGALVYALHCPELAAPFLGLWYLLGVLIPAGVGALLGPRLLRW